MVPKKINTFTFYSIVFKKVRFLELKYGQKLLDKVVICSVTLIQTIYLSLNL